MIIIINNNKIYDTVFAEPSPVNITFSGTDNQTGLIIEWEPMNSSIYVEEYIITYNYTAYCEDGVINGSMTVGGNQRTAILNIISLQLQAITVSMYGINKLGNGRTSSTHMSHSGNGWYCNNVYPTYDLIPQE